MQFFKLNRDIMQGLQAFRFVMRHQVWRFVIITVWIAIQCYLFINKYLSIMQTSKLQAFRKILGTTLAVSRASALLINFNSAIILLSCCRISLTWLRSCSIVSWLGLPIDDCIGMHRLTGYSIGIFSMIHAVGHYINFVKYARHSGHSVAILLFVNNTGLSGHLLLLVLALMIGTAAVPLIRSRKHEVFYYLHKLFILYFVLIASHGAFCFIKTDDPNHPCIAPQSWIWITPGLTLYMLELIYSAIRARRFTYVSKVILHQSKVFEIQIRKPSFTFTPGQYILINVPSVSWFQWHPFTVTSAPEDDFIAVHIRVVGDWTLAVASRFGIKEDPRSKRFGFSIETPEVMPRLYIDGPYGTPCQSFSEYEVVVCVGAGIGQTPFSSVLRSIWYSVVHPSEDVALRKIIYVGICRSIQSFEWFHDVLRALESQDTGHFLDIRYFLTGQLRPDQVHDIMHARMSMTQDPITGLSSQTFFGRPNFEPILAEIVAKYSFCKIGLFYCGPPKLAAKLSRLCKRYSTSDAKISFHKERFEQ